jgi:hypothetical protein
VARVRRDELGGGHVGEELAAPDDDQVVGGQRHLAHQVARHQHGAALGGERLEELADPADALGVQAVDRFVEHQDRGVAEQGGGEAEPLLHAERVPLDPPVRHRLQAGQPEHLGDPVPPDPVALRDRGQVQPGGAAAVQGGRVQQRADLVQRPDQPVVPPSVDQGGAGGGGIQADDDLHRGGLARAVRPEEAGHVARADREAQVVQRDDGAEALADPVQLDHAGVALK